LADIAGYLRARNRAATNLTTFAELGRVQDAGVRKIVELRFGYLIYYHIDKVSNILNFVTIQHAKRDRPYTDK
jgi:hypothetical protein